MVIIRFYESSEELAIKRGNRGGSAGLESFTREWPDNKHEQDALLLELRKEAPKINTAGCRFTVVGGDEKRLASGVIFNKTVRHTPKVELKEV